MPASAQASSGPANPQVARVISRAREQVGLSSTDIAKIMGIGTRQVQNWAAGKGKPADSRRLRQLLDLSYVLEQLDDLFDDEGAMMWLHGRNRTLGGQRPLDLLAEGRTDEVIKYLDRLVDGNL